MKTIRVKHNQKWGEEVFGLLSWFDLDKVSNAKVMVVGAGALGNEVLKNLALFGVGNIVVVDYDTIEYSNLSRSVLFRLEDAGNKEKKVTAAATRIKEINPDVKVFPIHGNVGSDVGLGIFREMDVIIGCLDSRYARFLINQHCFRANKSWIDGGIENLEGYVRVFAPDKNCYECSLTDEELEILAVKTGCPDIAKKNSSQGRIATTPVSASIIGAVQVQEALKIIHNKNQENPIGATLEGKLFKYDGMHLTAKVFNMRSYNKDCLAHEVWEPLITAIDLSAETRIDDALKIIKNHTKSNQAVINLRNNTFVRSLTTEIAETEYEVLLPESKIGHFLDENSLGIDTSGKIFQDYIENIGDDFKYKFLTLNQVGIPHYDIIQVSTSRGISYVELSKDKEYLNNI